MSRTLQVVGHSYYSHVSLSLKADLSELYSFSRYYKETPFDAGFIAESPLRYLFTNKDVPLKVYRIPITSDQKDYLQEKFDRMLANKDAHKYSFIEVVSYKFPITPLKEENKHTCLSFTVEVLSELGIIPKIIGIKRMEQLQSMLDLHYEHELSAFKVTEKDRYEWGKDIFERRALNGL